MSEQRETNLRRWSKLAPEECELWWGEIEPVEPEFDSTDRSLLLSALIEAIRARGWHYTLFSDETEPEDENPCVWHGARVLVVPQSRVGRSGGNESKEPCDALLSAYVSALESLAGDSGRKEDKDMHASTGAVAPRKGVTNL